MIDRVAQIEPRAVLGEHPNDLAVTLQRRLMNRGRVRVPAPRVVAVWILPGLEQSPDDAGMTEPGSQRKCPIKGNVSRSGERNYHMPWQSTYARVKIDEKNGERWFCSEADARAAGFAPAEIDG